MKLMLNPEYIYEHHGSVHHALTSTPRLHCTHAVGLCQFIPALDVMAGVFMGGCVTRPDTALYKQAWPTGSALEGSDGIRDAVNPVHSSALDPKSHSQPGPAACTHPHIEQHSMCVYDVMWICWCHSADDVTCVWTQQSSALIGWMWHHVA